MLTPKCHYYCGRHMIVERINPAPLSFFSLGPQKSGGTACGIGSAEMPGNLKELGLSAHRISTRGPSGALANCVRRSIGTRRTAASYCRKRWMASQGIV